MKNNLLKYALTVMVLFIAAATCPAQEEGPPMVGGYKEVPKTDKTVIIAARFAVLEQRDKDASLKLVAIKRAARQTVQGANYELCLAVTSGNKPQEATAVVYQDLQNELSLTSWKSGKCSANAAAASKFSSEKSGGRLFFSINDKAIKKIAFEAFTGGKINFIGNENAIDFGDLTMAR